MASSFSGPEQLSGHRNASRPEIPPSSSETYFTYRSPVRPPSLYMYRLVLVNLLRDEFNIRLFMKPIRDLLPELRKAKGWSRDRLSHEAFNVDPVGTSSQQIASIELGRRPASARTMAALATALGEDPRVFIEYRLALARHILDEQKVGLEQAAKNLERSGLEPIDVPLDQIREHSHRRRRTIARAQEIAEETVRRAQPRPRNR